MAGVVISAVSGLIATASDPSTYSSAAADADTTTTSSPPATIRPLTAMAPPGHSPVITRVETTDPVVFLTIDDGFTREPGLVTLLDELDIPVTSFLVDQAVRDGAAFFRSLPDTTVEAHTRSHPDLRSLPEEAQRAEICDNADTIASTFGHRPVLFRPPEGSHDAATQRAAAACGMAAIVLWEVVVEQGEIRFRSVRELRAGDIVLLHFKPGLPDDIRMLVQQVEEAGLQVGRLEDYLAPA
jgi:peptidoglycan/xylan/chitin deacetylase (PgdA/CDA1 family)